MSFVTDLPQTSSPPEAPVRRGRPLLAWLAVAGMVGFILYRAATVAAPDKQAVELILMELQARSLVGLAAFTGGKDPALYVQAKAFDRGPYEQRLRFVPLAGELAGSGEALDRLADLERIWSERPEHPTDEQKTVANLLRQLYWGRQQGKPDTATLSETDREELRRRLGWFGELALAPPRHAEGVEEVPVRVHARRTTIRILLAGLVWLAAGFLGLLLLLVAVVLVAVGRLRAHFRTGSPNSGLYAETFAVWMALFMGLSWGASYLPLRQGHLLVSGLAGLATLVALGWPVLRGASWREVRRDVGLSGGGNPALEPVVGVGCYLAALPMLGVGLLLSALLIYLNKRFGAGEDPFGPSNSPSHPVIADVIRASGWQLLEILFVVSVVAPLVEETMFRGVLYRHLREVSGGSRRAVSVLVSALAVSFVFAVIHPQGWAGVPALMALAVALALAREWRDSLVPSMVAHGIHNGLLLGMMLLSSR
jgi:membrane protease YdiL (CAAX protease family)